MRAGAAHLMRQDVALGFLLGACLLGLALAGDEPSGGPVTTGDAATSGSPVPLPSPRLGGPLSLEEALARRRSVRDFSDRPLSVAEVGQLLWAAQGITDPAGRRTAPSAGALYPLELYAVTPEGILHYDPVGHAVTTLRAGDRRAELASAAWDQDAVAGAAVTFVIAAVHARTEAKYGPQRGARYVLLEAGHAAQNILLEAVALDLGAVPIGAFADDRVAAVLGLPADRAPLYLVAVGHPE